MKHSTIALLAAASLAVAAASCGGSAKEQTADTAVVEERNTQLAEALSAGNLKEASAMADSMSLFVDDFTPEQTVQVLMAFLSVHNDAVAKKESRRDLETLRKYVDVYDIALSVNPKDTRSAFDKARKLNPAVNFDSLARVFREKLTQYDAIHDGSLVNDGPAVPDSAAADTAATDTTASRLPATADKPSELPLELRPAE